MKRLTKRLSNGATSWNYQSDCYGEDETRNKVFRSVHRQNACEKLAAYEDTGLEPEDFKRAFNEDAVLKLAGQALNITPDRLRELAQADRLLGKKVYEPNKRGIVSTYEVISVHISYCSVLVGWNLIDGIYSNLNGFEISALGKSVFLTRAEAETALRREQDG